MEIELRLEQSRIQTWWTHKVYNYPVGDDLLKKRMKILKNKKLHLQFSVPRTLPEEKAQELLRDIIRAARIIHLDRVELYFAEEADDWGPFSIRNELEALNSILSSIKSLSLSEYDTQGALAMLLQGVIFKIVLLGFFREKGMNRLSFCQGPVPFGIVTKLKVAKFQEAGRGLVASENVRIGDVALEVPMHLVISDDFIELDMDMSGTTKQITHSSRRLVWTMRERRAPRKQFCEFFEPPSEELKSGVRFCGDAMRVLCGTPLESALVHEKAALKFQFRSEIQPVLDELTQSKDYSFDEFMEAWELWNSCSVSIVFPDEKLRACLVPVARFFNHSQCPHILYGKHVVSANSENTIKFIASRPCMEGDQCFLSYGNHSAVEFITFYGFLPKTLNYHDVVSFEFGDDLVEEYTVPPKDKRHWSSQMVRGAWPYSKKSGLTKGLIDHVKSVMKDEDGSHPDVYEVLMERFMGINLGLQHGSLILEQDKLDQDTRLDVKLAYDYRKHYEEVLRDAVTECCNVFCPDDEVD